MLATCVAPAQFQRPAAASTPPATLTLALQERPLALRNPLRADRQAMAADPPPEKQKRAAQARYHVERVGSDHIPPEPRRQAQQ